MVPTPVRRRPTLRRLTPGDRRSFLQAVARSRALHHPWAYPPDTPDAFDAYIEIDRARHALAVVVDHEEPLVGVYALSQIHHGSFRNAYLGYYAFVPHAGTGYMRESTIERMARDARVQTIGGGATEVMLEEVAKRLKR